VLNDRGDDYGVRRGLARVVGLVAMLLIAPGAVGQEATGLQAHFGKQGYRLFCAGCHGHDGTGNPELAEALGKPLSDLTTIAKRNGGSFPREVVADAITGRGAKGHRELALRPWDEMFADEFERIAEEVVANEMVARRIDHLLAYLESIQR
jgi:hypothetical protein